MSGLIYLRIRQTLNLARQGLEPLLTMALAALLARALWLFIAPTASVTPIRAAQASFPSARAITPALPVVDLSILVARNPFAAVTDDVVTGLVDTDAPETSLNLILKGVRTITGSDAGSAIIVLPDNTQKLFQVGDTLLSGVTIERILADRVLLRKNGALESLAIRDDRGSSLILSTARGATENAVPPSDRPQSVSASALLRAMAPLPLYQDGRVVAYTIGGASDHPVLRVAGLQFGDILRQINGVPAADLTVDELAREVQEARGVDLNIDRGGRTLAVNLAFGEEN